MKAIWAGSSQYGGEAVLNPIGSLVHLAQSSFAPAAENTPMGSGTHLGDSELSWAHFHCGCTLHSQPLIFQVADAHYSVIMLGCVSGGSETFMQTSTFPPCPEKHSLIELFPLISGKNWFKKMCSADRENMHEGNNYHI